MLLITLLLLLGLLLLSPYRIWLLYALGGLVFSAALTGLTLLVAQLLPDGLKLFSVVLSFLVLNGGLFWLTSLAQSPVVAERHSTQGMREG